MGMRGRRRRGLALRLLRRLLLLRRIMQRQPRQDRVKARVKLNPRRNNLADDGVDWEGIFLGRTEVVWDGFDGLDQSMNWTVLDWTGRLAFGREFLWPFPSLPFKLLSGLVLCRYLFSLTLCMGSCFACSFGVRVGIPHWVE